MQLVIAAITTWPLSSSVSVPSAIVTGTCVRLWRATGVKPWFGSCCGASCPGPAEAGGSLAGKLSSLSSSCDPSSVTYPLSSSRNALCAFDSATRSCGRLGPAIDGTTVPRSSATVSLKVGSSASASCQRPCSLA